MTRPLALITGGVRRLGAVIAARFAQAGYDLALTTHLDGEIEDDLAEILTGADGDWHQFIADLSDPSIAADVVADVVGHFGRCPDILVNNAAIFGQDDWQGMDGATLAAHFNLNMFAPILLTRALVNAKNGAGQVGVIHILDQRIANPHGDQISYTLSKQALASSVRTLATAFGGRARVNGVAPGLVIETGDYAPGQGEGLSKMMPLGALPDPQNVAEAVLYLARASDVTGQILYVDGGAHLKSFDRDFMHL